MEEKNELSDILLEQKSSSKITQFKRLVVIAVLLILLFVLVILIMKFISKPDGDETEAYPTLQQQIDPEKSVIEIPASNISVETIEESNTTNNETNETFANIFTENHTTPVIIETPPVATAKTPKTPTTTTTQPVQTNVAASIQNSNTVKSGHYIQVGSFSNPPNKTFLDNIAKKDYEYHLYKTAIKSKQVTLVLVGPYPSESVARDTLLDVKATISKDAFYKKIQ
jgi:DedD protein